MSLDIDMKFHQVVMVQYISSLCKYVQDQQKGARLSTHKKGARKSWKLRKGKCVVFLISFDMNAKLPETLSFFKQNQFTFGGSGTFSGDFCLTHCTDSSDSISADVIDIDLETSTFLLLTADLEDSESEDVDNCFSLLLHKELDLDFQLHCSFFVLGHNCCPCCQCCPKTEVCPIHRTDHTDPLHHSTNQGCLPPHFHFLVQLKYSSKISSKAYITNSKFH